MRRFSCAHYRLSRILLPHFVHLRLPLLVVLLRDERPDLDGPTPHSPRSRRLVQLAHVRVARGEEEELLQRRHATLQQLVGLVELAQLDVAPNQQGYV